MQLALYVHVIISDWNANTGNAGHAKETATASFRQNSRRTLMYGVRSTWHDVTKRSNVTVFGLPICRPAEYDADSWERRQPRRHIVARLYRDELKRSEWNSERKKCDDCRWASDARLGDFRAIFLGFNDVAMHVDNRRPSRGHTSLPPQSVATCQ